MAFNTDNRLIAATLVAVHGLRPRRPRGGRLSCGLAQSCRARSWRPDIAGVPDGSSSPASLRFGGPLPHPITKPGLARISERCRGTSSIRVTTTEADVCAILPLARQCDSRKRGTGRLRNTTSRSPPNMSTIDLGIPRVYNRDYGSYSSPSM